MDKELPLARKEDKGQSMLLASSGSGENTTESSSGDKRSEANSTTEGAERGKIKDSEAESKSSTKAEGTNDISKSEGYRRGHKVRKQNRRNEGENKKSGRSAKELGITHPGSYCIDEVSTRLQPHYWIEEDNVDIGTLYRCLYCKRHLWLPSSTVQVEILGELVKKFGKDGGYCKYLDRHRPTKIIMAKMEYLYRLSKKITIPGELVKEVRRVMADKDFDRKET